MRPIIHIFLDIKEPIQRSNKLISLYKELIEIINKKLSYVQEINEEFKLRSPNLLLE